MKSPSLLCFGEALWDCLPRGLFLGGAPLNVGYHLAQCGYPAAVVSAVGDDFLGREILRRAAALGVKTEWISTCSHKPTGTVQASIDTAGNASYQIHQDVAWDWIDASPALLDAGRQSPLLVYGTLAQREAHNQAALYKLLAVMPTAHRICDVNLRKPFDTPGIVFELMKTATLIKLNDEELGRLLKQPALSLADLEAAARQLSAQTGVTAVCVTAAAAGAGLLWNNQWHWSPGRIVDVKDTVGAGDAFLAGLIHHLLMLKLDPMQSLHAACRLGEFVATCDGPTPSYDVAKIWQR